MVKPERNPAYTAHNIPINPDNFYRGIETEAYDDFWSAEDDSTEVMRGNGKGGTDRLSSQAGFPNNLYFNGLVKANMIIEGTNAMGTESRTGDG